VVRRLPFKSAIRAAKRGCPANTTSPTSESHRVGNGKRWFRKKNMEPEVETDARRQRTATGGAHHRSLPSALNRFLSPMKACTSDGSVCRLPPSPPSASPRVEEYAGSCFTATSSFFGRLFVETETMPYNVCTEQSVADSVPTRPKVNILLQPE